MRTNVKDTSIDAYDDLRHTIKLGKMQQDVLNVMKPNTIYTRRELSRITKLETSTIAGRVNELIEAGYIDVVNKIKCPITNKTVEALTLTENRNDGSN
jgi:DNA-binding MarR family transcriptional regulator